MELAISTEHHPEHVNAPEQRGGRLWTATTNTAPAVYISLQCVFLACVGGQVTTQSLVHNWLCRAAVTVKRTAGEVNCPDKAKLLYVAFTFDVLCWNFLTCGIFFKPLKQPPIKLLLLLPFKAINSWEGEEKLKCSFIKLLLKYKIEMGKNYHLGWVFKVLWSGLVTSKSASVWSQASSSGGWQRPSCPQGWSWLSTLLAKKGMLIILSIAARLDV